MRIFGALVGIAVSGLAGMTPAEAESLRALYSRPVQNWPAPDVGKVDFVEFAPLPKVPSSETATRRAALGARLFHDRALSAGKDLSCASCHDPALGFTTRTPQAIGHGGVRGTRNPIALFDTSFSPSFGWDGGSEDLHARLLAPLTDPTEMGNADIGDVLQALESSPAMRADFAELFDADRIAPRHLSEAFAAYLAAQNPRRRFDRFLEGATEVLTDIEIEGLHLFRTKAGCANCHFGPRLTDDRFHNLGLSAFREPGEDLGRYQVTGRAEDAGKFRTPSLRHIGQTGPYMHHGLFERLDGVVSFYARGGGEIWARNAAEAKHPLHRHVARISPLLRPRDLTGAEKAALVAFLKTL